MGAASRFDDAQVCHQRAVVENFDFVARQEKRESRANGSHQRGKWKKAQPNFVAEESTSIATYWHPSRALPSKGEVAGVASWNGDSLDESVENPIKYSVRPPQILAEKNS